MQTTRFYSFEEFLDGAPGRTFLDNSIPLRSRSTSAKIKGRFINGHFWVRAMLFIVEIL